MVRAVSAVTVKNGIWVVLAGAAQNLGHHRTFDYAKNTSFRNEPSPIKNRFNAPKGSWSYAWAVVGVPLSTVDPYLVTLALLYMYYEYTSLGLSVSDLQLSPTTA